jgi:hypothetical protein
MIFRFLQRGGSRRGWDKERMYSDLIHQLQWWTVPFLSDKNRGILVIQHLFRRQWLDLYRPRPQTLSITHISFMNYFHTIEYCSEFL